MDCVHQSRLLIIQTLSRDLNDVDESQLDEFNSRGAAIIADVLEMISDNLLFDDPGIFYTHLVYDEQERLIQESINMWLINQTVYLTTISKNER